MSDEVEDTKPKDLESNASEYSFIETRALAWEEPIDPPSSPEVDESRYDWEQETRASTNCIQEKSVDSAGHRRFSNLFPTAKTKPNKVPKLNVNLKSKTSGAPESKHSAKKIGPRKHNVYKIDYHDNSAKFEETHEIVKRPRSDWARDKSPHYYEDSVNSLLKAISNNSIINLRRIQSNAGKSKQSKISYKINTYVSKPKSKVGSARLSQPDTNQPEEVNLSALRRKNMNEGKQKSKFQIRHDSDKKLPPPKILGMQSLKPCLKHKDFSPKHIANMGLYRYSPKVKTSINSLPTTVDTNSVADSSPYTPAQRGYTFSKFMRNSVNDRSLVTSSFLSRDTNELKVKQTPKKKKWNRSPTR